MRPFLLFLLFISLISLSSGQTTYSTEEMAFTRKLEAILKDCETIKPGMTRADLLKVFTLDGGLSIASERKYTYRTCCLIKVRVTFKEIRPYSLTELPTDIIETISQPFIERPIMD